MRKTVTENGIEYRLEGGLSRQEEPNIGYWGEQHRKYLKEYHKDITEELKAKNKIEWVRRMTNIQARARETVLNELIRF